MFWRKHTAVGDFWRYFGRRATLLFRHQCQHRSEKSCTTHPRRIYRSCGWWRNLIVILPVTSSHWTSMGFRSNMKPSFFLYSTKSYLKHKVVTYRKEEILVVFSNEKYSLDLLIQWPLSILNVLYPELMPISLNNFCLLDFFYIRFYKTSYIGIF